MEQLHAHEVLRQVEQNPQSSRQQTGNNET